MATGEVFDDPGVALTYTTVRPDYDRLDIEALMGHTGWRPGDRVVEAGMGPGNFTWKLLTRGIYVAGVEPSTHLREVAEANLEHHVDSGRLTTIGQPFLEAVAELPSENYHGIVAATSYKWLGGPEGAEAAVQYEMHRLLRNAGLGRGAGSLAIINNMTAVFGRDNRFFDATLHIHQEHYHSGRPLPHPGDLKPEAYDPDLFDLVHFGVSIKTDKLTLSQYLARLSTISAVIELPEGQRQRLRQQITEVANAEPFNGQPIVADRATTLTVVRKAAP